MMYDTRWNVPRLGVYVPDGLWDEARSLEPKLNPSQLIQAGLRQYIEAERGPRRTLPPDAKAAIEEIRRQKVADAERRYQNGFATGLGWAKEWPWWGIDKLAGLNWDIPTWIKDLVVEDGYTARRSEWWAILGIQEPDVTDFDLDLAAYEHESMFRQGAQDALREVWNAVRHGQSTDIVTAGSLKRGVIDKGGMSAPV